MTVLNEEIFFQRLLEYKLNSKKFQSWERIQDQHSSALYYAKRKRKRSAWNLFVLLLVGLVAYFCYLLGLPTLLKEENCLISMPEILQDLWRPPLQNCNFCKISSIHVRTNLSSDEFYDTYAYSGLPLLVADGMRDWNTGIFSFEYFKELYANVPDEDNEDCQFFGYRTKFLSITDVFRMPEERANFHAGHEPWYIGWSNCVPKVTATLRDHYTVPYFLERSERTREDWMFMGSPGYKGAPLHIDAVYYNSWQAQIKGRKKWQFVPPPECWSVCPHKHTVVVEPGSIFVFDSNRWYHATEVLQGEYSLTIGAEYD